jgi:peroxiredoxin
VNQSVNQGIGLDEGQGTMTFGKQAAIPLELPDTTGKLHHLSDYQGSWLLLVFHRHLM